MRKLIRKTALLGTAAALFAAGVAAAQVSEGPKLDANIATDFALIAPSLTGDKEVPPTAETGTGYATVTLNAAGGVCLYFEHSIAEPITALHIHPGAAGATNPPLVDFQITAGGSTISVCVTTTTANVAAIAANPGNYYLNAHTATFPGGAIRSQLRARGSLVGNLAMLAEPLRVYDSRAADGKLAAGQTRTIDISRGRRGDGTLVGTVPFGVRAAMVILTVTGTENAGYAVIYANSLTEAPNTSSINWSGSNQDVATTTTVIVDGRGRVKVTAGPTGGAHILIDVLGAYL